MHELLFEKNDILFTLKHLEKWTKDQKVPGMPLMLQALRAKTRQEPYGSVLIIGFVLFDLRCSDILTVEQTIQLSYDMYPGTARRCHRCW